MTTPDSPAALRNLQRLRNRRKAEGDKYSTYRHPFVAAHEASERFELLLEQGAAVGSKISAAEDDYERNYERAYLEVADLRDALNERDNSEKADAADVRGDGTDTTTLGQNLQRAESSLEALRTDHSASLEAMRAELARLSERAEEARKEALEDVVHFVFGKLGATEFETLLVQHGGVDAFRDPDKERPFLNALLAETFKYEEFLDGSRMYRTWPEVVDEYELGAGDIGPIRVKVLELQGQSGANIPFASLLSGRTPTS